MALLLLLGGTGWWVFSHHPSAPQDGGDFRVETLAQGSGALARNEPLIVEFSEALSKDSPVDALVEIHAEDGALVPFVSEISGRRLLLRPAAAAGWPPGVDLKLAVREGRAVPLKATSGRVLVAPFATRFAVRDAYQDQGSPFRVISSPQALLTQVERGAEFVWRFSLPVDPSSLETGRPAVVVFKVASHNLPVRCQLDEGGFLLRVRPFVPESLFEGNTEYRITLHAGRLRSVTGKTLETSSVTRFWTAATESSEGQIDVSFKIADLDFRQNLELPRDGLFARPLLAHQKTIEIGGNPIATPGIRFPTPWSRESAALQLLVPGEILGEASGILTGFSFLLREALTEPVLFPRLRLRVGYAPAEVLRNGLSPNLSQNFAAAAPLVPWEEPIETVAAGSTAGELLLQPAEAGSWVTVDFDRPFTYSGGMRALVLEISNDLGATSPDPAGVLEGFDSLPWAAEISGRGLPLAAFVGPGMIEGENGRAEPLTYALRLHLERTVDIVSAWYEAEIDQPQYFLVKSADYLDSEGTENEDFRFEFQGLEADHLTPWTRLDALSGCRKIRVKLKFLPKPGGRLDLGPEVRRLRIRYRRAR